MKLKVCGMKHNIAEVAALRPDYLGFIFWDKSSRFFDGEIPALSEATKKVGVFVNAPIDQVLENISKYKLNAVQLHGSESPRYCKNLKNEYLSTVQQENKENEIEIIKVFSIKNEFDFSVLVPYEEVCDYFLFDTKGKLPGGNGYSFDWSVLKNYPSTKPYFLSGGIGLQNVESIVSFMKQPESQYCQVIDVNSKFEIAPGLKNIEELENFKNALWEI